ncbi:endonuclease domain-containing protein [Thalassovita mediterranea]|nr:endonuclease domain-containing protein [Thalassovita mediterranea]
MSDPRTTGRARRLRQTANAPEDRAWQTLRKLRAHGFPVKRQYPIGPYIVDFAIYRARLAIEIDGLIHQRADIAGTDPVRQHEIEAMGWRVVRFSAEEALDANLVWRRVSDFLNL